MTAAEAIRTYMRRYAGLRALAVRQIAAIWTAISGVDDEAERVFVRRALAVTGASQVTAIVGVHGYLALLREAVGEALDPRDVPPGAAAVLSVPLRGVDPADLYRRPIITARKALHDGKTFDEAMRAGRLRAGQLAETDVILAQRAGMATATGSDRRIVGYRRVLTGESCRFCATASTQRYRKGQLMPLHPRCDCGIAPLWGERDPGQVINKELLATLKGKGEDHWKRAGFVDSDGNPIEPGSDATPLAIRQHGELGPVLTDPTHHFDHGGTA